MKKSLTLLLSSVLLLVLVAFGGVLLGKYYFTDDAPAPVEPAVDPLEIIETFEISALEYHYRNLVFEENVEERTFLFIDLPPAVKRYAVQYEGAIQMGINAKDIVIEVASEIAEPEIEGQAEGGKAILMVTIPNAYIISHEAPLNDTLNVIFDEAVHTEKYTLGEYANTLTEEKKEIEAEADQSGLLEQAQESAGKQLESFLRAIPDIRDNYTLEFVLE